MQKIKIETDKINDWNSFHDEFKTKFGFPNFYGNNMNAWIDCMSYLDDPDSGMSKVIIHKNDILVLEIDNINSFKKRCPEQYEALIDCSAFVNHRLIENNENPFLLLSFNS